MFNMGFTEMLVLGVIALIVIGPKQLPEVAKIVARTINEFKRATSDITSSFHTVKHDAEKYVSDTREYMHKQKDEFQSKIENQILNDEDKPIPHEPTMDEIAEVEKKGESSEEPS